MNLKLLSLFLLSFLCCACAGTFEQPEQPAKIAAKGNFYTDNQFKDDLGKYDTSVDLGTTDSLKQAKLIRDKMVTSIAADIDYNYGEYKGRAHVARAGINTVGDAASLGLTAAITVVGGTALKSILGAADTALKGTVQSYNNNFYEQKATEIIINSMDAIRTAKETEIIKNLSLPVDQYPFGEAKMDLIKLFFLGTREAGLATLEADAGKKQTDATTAAADAAQEKVDKISLIGSKTDDQVAMAKAIRWKIDSINAGGDGALPDGLSILKRAGMTPTDSKSLKAVITDLHTLAAKANDSTKLQSVYDSFFP